MTILMPKWYLSFLAQIYGYFLSISFGILSTIFVKFGGYWWVFFGRIKIGPVVIWFLWLPFIGINLVSVCHFPENDISSAEPQTRPHISRQRGVTLRRSSEEAFVPS